MQDDFAELKKQWRSATPPVAAIDSARIIAQANEKRKASLQFHYGNMLVLAGVVVVLIVFFFFLFPFQEILSNTGVWIMIVSLVVRIVIEYYSAIRSRRISMTDTAVSNTNTHLEFYQFRKRIHGPVTVLLVATYSIGFLMLTPEFYDHIGSRIFFFDVLYLVGACFLVWQVRKGIKKEMADLLEIIELKKQIESA